MALTIAGDERMRQHWHGLSGSPMYRIWGLIKQRCYNPTNASYREYGARGIVMCDEWRYDFHAFARDLGPRPSAGHSVDRIDNDGPYAPWNCRWATRSEQARNRRNTRVFELDGQAGTLAEWAERTGVRRSTLAQRYYGLGWDVERTLTTPTQRRGPLGGQ